MCSSFWITGRLNLWLLYFVYKVPGACLLSYFSNKFFEDITILGTVRTLVFWGVLVLLLQGKDEYACSQVPEMDEVNTAKND